MKFPSAKKEVTENERHDQRANEKSRPSHYLTSSGESTTLLRSERSPLGGHIRSQRDERRNQE